MNLLIVVIGAILALVAFAAIKLMRLSFRDLALGLGGTIVGLLLGALLSAPLGRLPEPFGSLLPIVVSVLVTVMMIGVFLNQRQHVAGFSAWIRAINNSRPSKTASSGNQILVDTSVIIDGRIADIAQTGFVPGKLLVPRFVLAELQNIADSDDAMRRGRGRRGLEMLKTIQNTPGIDLEIIDDDVPEIREVDAKLVHLGNKRGADILTTDYNLNRVAQIEGVRVLNINELSNAIRPVVLPGEEMLVKIVQVGKERNQGVGYLPDGTMIVVENGDRLIGQEVITEVTRVFQTVAGKMIFATPKSNSNGQAVASGVREQTKSRRNQNNHRRSGRNSQTIDNSPSAIEDRLIQENSTHNLEI